MKKFLSPVLALFLVTTIMTGCALILAPKLRPIEVSSQPGGADVFVNGTRMGTTPIQLKLKPKSSYTIEFRKEGYASTTRTVSTKLDAGFVILDVICGAWPVLIDAVTESWYRFDQKAVDAVLQSQNTQNTSTATGQPQYRGSGDPLKGLNVSKSDVPMKIGKYYALFIGIDSYTGEWPALKNAVNDAQAIEQMIKSKYRFDEFRTLYNEKATRLAIIKQMEWLVENVGTDDNVFIYYSGHGEFKDKMNKGYWVPVDARTKSVSGYISNNDIQAFLNGIKSKHTLLVSDACFSGDLFRGSTVSVPFEDTEKYYRIVHNLPSRSAITSGGIEPVMDGGRDGHSVFAYYFLKALENNTATYMDAGQVYGALKIPVVNNSDQSPIFSPIKNTGDEGGQFVFIKK